ncbi:hypothetical protein [Sphingomonas sp.]|uniref:hypothetical protein n=1 Tax=Sphingomonas sp. TaxID=28214 RepID=UPI001EC3E646|nr:hypothetical protein [Sphingomonas sp.]MBX3595212.1 hypothetical protein [Sphingomonas sp.]
MPRKMRTGTKFATIYAILAILSIAPLFVAGGASNVAFGLAMVLAIALIPVTAIVMAMAPLFRRAQPAAATAPTASTTGASTPVVERDHFEFAFDGRTGFDSRQAVAQLSAKLDSLDIAHRFNGEIAVEDGDVRWRVAPVPGTLRIRGWVEAPDAESRTMIEAAIEEFLSEELGIRLERMAA